MDYAEAFSAFMRDGVNNFIFSAVFCLMAALSLTRLEKNFRTVYRIAAKTALVYAAYFVFYLLIFFPTVYLSQPIRSYILFYLPPMAACVAAICIIKDYKFSARIVLVSLLLTTWFLLPSVNFLLLSVLSWNINLMNWLRVAVFIALSLLFKKWNLDKFGYISFYGVLIFESVCLICCIVQLISQFNIGNDEYLTICFISLVIWVMEMFVYIFFYLFSKNYDMKIESETESLRLKNEIRLLDFSRGNYEDMRKLKHDMKNQYSYIALLYAQGKDGEAKEYFLNLAKKTDELLSFASCGNLTMDVTLNMEKYKAENRGIDFNYSCSVPEKINIKDNDLFSFFVNILDNAIEGSERADTEEKRIEVAISVKGGCLIARIANTVENDKVLSVGETSKENKAEHGFGSKIINSICKKYNGEISRRVENGEYIIEAMLSLSEDAA